MPETPAPPPRHAGAGAAPGARRESAGRYQLLRGLAGRAYQLRAAARGANHFLTRPAQADRDTGAWLVNTAVDQALDIASELDGLARSLRDGSPDPALAQPVPRLRARAHQLLSAARAADHFLDQESSDDRETGGWLIVTTLSLAGKLAAELDDLASTLQRSANDSVIDADHAAVVRRAGAATSAAG
jgi:hypothetical protein